MKFIIAARGRVPIKGTIFRPESTQMPDDKNPSNSLSNNITSLPARLKQVENILPGAADRLLHMAEYQHQAVIDDQVDNSKASRQLRLISLASHS
jgi:uncharacterized membrane protein